ncbi:MAG: hypothetical protein PHD26_00470 [Methanosarcinaceae archaeon]|nr:hypothetical protein [Methanosarcinaceae archaeon]
MKKKTLLLAVSLILLLSETGAAAFSYTNNITLNAENASWEYKEYVTNMEASFSRQLIDSQTGNNDNFVNVWELLDMERRFEAKLQKSLEKNPDLKLNNSSEPATVSDLEYHFSEKSLGNVFKKTALENRAQVSYKLKKGALTSGTELWLRGTPESKVRVTLPPGLEVNGSEGLKDRRLAFINERAVLKGRFGAAGEITLRLSENKTYGSNLAEEALKASKVEQKNESAAKKPVSDPSPNLFNYFGSLTL